MTLAGRGSASGNYEIGVHSAPEMAHRTQDSIIKLNWPRNQQSRVFCLARHLLFLLLW